MTAPSKISRRRLLGQALGAGITLPLFISSRKDPAPGGGAPVADPPPTDQPSSQDEPAPGPNDQVGVGIIGCGRRNGQLAIGKGGQGMRPEYARVVAVADINKRRAAAWGKEYGCPHFDDYQRWISTL